MQPSYPLPADAQALQALASRLEHLAGERGCLADAYFHAWRGAVLMALGQPANAIEPLERALLTLPDLPGAQLDLAQAMAQQGDAAAAAALLDALQQRDDLPPHLRVALERQRKAQVAPGTALGSWVTRWQLSSLAGVDSNLNNAPAATELTLTFPQGDVTLPLAPGSLPQRGAALLTTLQWQGLRPSGPSLWVLQAELRDRHTRSADTRYLQADLAATWLQAPEAPRQWVARAGATRLQFGGRTLLQAGRASLQYQWARLDNPRQGLFAAAADCRPSASLELEDRRFPGTPELAGLYAGGALALLCTPAKTSGPGFYSLQARAGQDRPRDASRPGGVQQRSELRAQWEGALASPLPGLLGPGRLSLQAASTLQTDSSGYSALLSNNAPRRTTRQALFAEASWPLGGGLWALLNAEAAVQRSNLAAFSARQHSLYLGFRWDLM